MKICFVLIAAACHFLGMGVLDFAIIFGTVHIIYSLWASRPAQGKALREYPHRLQQKETIVKTLAERMASEVLGQTGSQFVLQTWHTWATVRTQEAYNNGIKDFHKMLSDAAREANAHAPHKGSVLLVPLGDIANMADTMTRHMDQNIWEQSKQLDDAIKKLEKA